MRKSLVLSAACAPVVLSLFPISQSLAQAPASPPPEPPDPQALMHAAVQLNNLAADDVKPWHIKATFQLFDEQGVIVEQGAYEEFWASPSKFKRTFTGKNFSETAYGSTKGVLLSNAKGEFPDLLLVARNNLVSPMPFFEEIIRSTTYTTKLLNSGNIKLLCAVPTASSTAGPSDNSAYCFNTGEPILRIAARPSTSDQTFHNRLIRVEGRAVATELKIEHGGKLTVALHVTEATVLDPLDQAVFAPPSDAVLQPMRITIPANMAQGMLAYSVAPEYPIAAKRAKISGTVVLQAMIDTKGRLRNLKAISGPEALQGAAIQAVYQWRYHPYMLDGKPVEVMTTINVIFAL